MALRPDIQADVLQHVFEQLRQRAGTAGKAVDPTFVLGLVNYSRHIGIDSLPPADLQKVMTAEDLVDVVEYMTTLKKAKPR